MNTNVYESVKKYAAEIRDLPYEIAVFIDSETGEILAKFKGSSTGVCIPDSVVAEDQVLLHNHPLYSVPFSAADLHYFANNKLSAIAVISKNKMYFMEAPVFGWSEKPEIVGLDALLLSALHGPLSAEAAVAEFSEQYKCEYWEEDFTCL